MYHPKQTAFRPLDDMLAEPEGQGEWSLGEEIRSYVMKIRADRDRSPTRRQTPEREELRAVLNMELHQYGFKVTSLPNWRGANHV